jgi:hypothetical protein
MPLGPPLSQKEKRILVAFKLAGGWGRSAEARRAIGSDYAWWVLRKLRERGFMRHPERNRYELTLEGLAMASQLSRERIVLLADE